MNQAAAAYREFLAVLRLDPGYSKAYGNLAFLYLKAGKVSEARAGLAKSRGTRPGRHCGPRTIGQASARLA